MIDPERTEPAKRWGVTAFAERGSRRRFRLVALGVAAAVVTTVWAIVFSWLVYERHSVLSDGLRAASTLARDLADQQELALGEAAAEMDQAAALYVQGADAATLQSRLEALSEGAGGLQDLALVNAEGRVVAAMRERAGDDVSGRPEFMAHLEAGTPNLFIGTPAAGSGPGAGRVPLTRAIRGADGRLAGVVSASLDLQSILALQAAQSLPPDAAVVLARASGTPVLQIAGGGAEATSLGQLPAVTHVAGQKMWGAYVEQARGEGVGRITGYQTLPDAGVTLAVTLGLNPMLFQWRAHVAYNVGLAAVLTLVLAVFFWHMIRTVEQQRSYRDELEAANAAARRRTMQQQTLAAISQFSIEAESTEAFLNRVISGLRSERTAELAFVARRVGDGQNMMLVAGAGWDEGVVGRSILPDGKHSHAGFVSEIGEMVIVEDFRKEVQFEYSDLLRRHGVLSGLVVPIYSADDPPIACLGIYRRSPGTFAPDTVLFCSALAHSAAVHFEWVLENRLRTAAFDNSPGMIAVLDENGRVIVVNKAWRDVAVSNGLPTEDAGVGTNYLNVCRSSAASGVADARVMYNGISDILAARRSEFRHEYPCFSDTRERWFEAIVVSVDLGTQRGAIVVHIDNTEKRQAAKQIEEAQRMDVVGQLTGGVAHDFNNLLTIILGNAELLKRRLGNDPIGTTCTEAIVDAGRRGASLTSQLLAYSRRQSLEPTVVEPDKVLTGVRKLLSRTLRADIELVVDVASDCSPIVADETQLQTALINLILNARDAMPDGGRISVGCKMLGDPPARDDTAYGKRRQVRFFVADEGVGMSEDVAAHVFEPFFTTKPVGKGTGLGLSMVQGFAIQSGGAAHVSSVLGEGTVVCLDLPAAPDGTAECSPIAEIAPAETLKGHHVLVVEDETAVRDLILALLKDLECKVITAASGPEALRTLEGSSSIDIVISDVVMPGRMSGYRLASEIAELRPSLPVVLMTGYSDPDVVLRMRNFNPDIVVLQKPFTQAKLAEALLRATAA